MGSQSCPVSFLIKPHLTFHGKRNYFSSSYYSLLEAITAASGFQAWTRCGSFANLSTLSGVGSRKWKNLLIMNFWSITPGQTQWMTPEFINASFHPQRIWGLSQNNWLAEIPLDVCQGLGDRGETSRGEGEKSLNLFKYC